jgi:hypothetical protein
MPNRRGVGGHSSHGGLEPGAGRGEIALAKPHQAAPEIQLGDGEGRDAAVVMPRRGEQALGLRDLPTLSFERGEPGS